MAHSDDLREKLVNWLQDAYAMEHQIVQTLEGQAKDTARYPDVQTRIQQHLDETRQHKQRMAERLGAYEVKPSSRKSVGATVAGSLMGAATGGYDEPLVKMARDDYMTEHMEIAAYGALIAAAQAYGDTDTIQAAQANLRDEWRMSDWLERHLADAVLYSFQEDGVNVDASLTPTIQSVVAQSLLQTHANAHAESGSGSADGMPASSTASPDAIAMPPATGMGRSPDRLAQSERTLNASGDETDTYIEYPTEQTRMSLGDDQPTEQP
jgi:ferritin-like metal-binding protein YciE